jgi:hypothetical protein
MVRIKISAVLMYSVNNGPWTFLVVIPPLIHRLWKTPEMVQNKAITPICSMRDAFIRPCPSFAKLSGTLGLESQETPIAFKTSTMLERAPQVVKVRPGWRGE